MGDKRPAFFSSRSGRHYFDGRRATADLATAGCFIGASAGYVRGRRLIKMAVSLVGLLALLLLIVGIVWLVRGQVLGGVILIVLALVIGPGGYFVVR
ncbi:MAG: GPGG-motif small membrane protein [Bacillota bacterium]